MKAKLNTNTQESDKTITIFRYKVEELEKRLTQQHETIKNEIAIPLAKDLGAIQPSKPEADCTTDVYTGPIEASYAKMMVTAKKELQTEIESSHIQADKQEATKQLETLETELEKKKTDHRLKKKELEQCDNSLIKKAKRYKVTRLFLIFLVLVDTLLSGAALEAMGYPLIASYVIGLAIGIGIFFLAENLPEIIAKGKTRIARIGITVIAFSLLFTVFYILGIFRTTTFNGGEAFGSGISPAYFAALNLFFSGIATLVVYFKGLTKAEKETLDRYKITLGELEQLSNEITALEAKIIEIRTKQADSELARKQIQYYGRDIAELIQRFFEESQKTFYSTNCIHRSDGQVPFFFKDPIKQLPSFYNNLNL